MAGAVMVFAYGRPAPMPDVNIIRIMSRYFCLPDVTANDIRNLSDLALAHCPRGRARQYYYSLLDLGSACCKARPKCPGCPLERKCMTRRDVKLHGGLGLNVAEEMVSYIDK